MTDDKNVRDWDRILIRVPDGMKQRLADRAAANDRSMNTEIVEILQSELEGLGERMIRTMQDSYARTKSRIQETERELRNLQGEADWMALQIKHLKSAPVDDGGHISIQGLEAAMKAALKELDEKDRKRSAPSK